MFRRIEPERYLRVKIPATSSMLQQFLPGFRRSRPAPTPTRHLERHLEALELQAWSAPWHAKSDVYTRLGDLCMEARQRDRALSYYGLGIDAHLKTGRFGPAASLCRKVIALAPDVVRARCTLAFLSLGKGRVGEFEVHVSDYVQAACRAGQQELAATRLRLMARATDDIEIRLLLGHYLKKVGDPDAANDVLESVFRERKEGPPRSREEQRERWARILRVAITGPLEARERAQS